MTPKAWKDPYVPILWEVFPVFFYGGIGAMCMCAYWEHKHIKADVIMVVGKVKEFIAKCKDKRAKKNEIKEEENAVSEENSGEKDD